MPDVFLFLRFTSFAVVSAPAEKPCCTSWSPLQQISTLLDFYCINVELAADFRFFTLAAAVRAFKGEGLFFEQFAAFGAAEFRFNFNKFKRGTLAEGAFCNDAEIGLDGFSDITGVVTDDHVDFVNASAVVFTAEPSGCFYDLFCDW